VPLGDSLPLGHTLPFDHASTCNCLVVVLCRLMLLMYVNRVL